MMSRWIGLGIAVTVTASLGCSASNEAAPSRPNEDSTTSAIYGLTGEVLERLSCSTDVPSVESADPRAPQVVATPFAFTLGRWIRRSDAQFVYEVGIVNAVEPSIAAMSDAVWGVHRAEGRPTAAGPPKADDGFWGDVGHFNLLINGRGTSVVDLSRSTVPAGASPNTDGARIPLPGLIGHADFSAAQVDTGGRGVFVGIGPEFRDPSPFWLWKTVSFSTGTGRVTFSGTFSNRIPAHDGYAARDNVGDVSPYVRTVHFRGSCR